MHSLRPRGTTRGETERMSGDSKTNENAIDDAIPPAHFNTLYQVCYKGKDVDYLRVKE